MSGRIENSQVMEVEGHLGNGKVLLVDEEEKDLGTFCRALREADFEVFTCKSFEAGARCLESEYFDLVVVDQGSRDFKGRVVIERAIKQDRYRPVLVVTPCLDMNCYLEAMQMGAEDYMEKPLALADLLRFVRTHVRSKRSMAHGCAV